MEIRVLRSPDIDPLKKLIARIETFSPEEVVVACELVDAAFASSEANDQAADYRILVAILQGTVAGYICFGPTPMTDRTSDLYWIASAPEFRGKGVGSALVAHMEALLRKDTARLIRVETSAMEAYGPTRGFYQSMGYTEAARFKDFYKDGDDLIILSKRLTA